MTRFVGIDPGAARVVERSPFLVDVFVPCDGVLSMAFRRRVSRGLRDEVRIGSSALRGVSLTASDGELVLGVAGTPAAIAHWLGGERLVRTLGNVLYTEQARLSTTAWRPVDRHVLR